jgi:hypothetical protein
MQTPMLQSWLHHNVVVRASKSNWHLLSSGCWLLFIPVSRVCSYGRHELPGFKDGQRSTMRKVGHEVKLLDTVASLTVSY